MDDGICAVGLMLTLGGALALALADLWFSRLLLVYLDELEANVVKLADAVRKGSKELENTGIDLKRDRRQNRARRLKTLGWSVFLLGLGIQIIAANLTKFLK